MNLYRSFGNLMEAWVTEGAQGSDSAWLGNNYEDPSMRSSDVGTNIRTESVDSGVETASSVTSLPPTPSSVSADHTEIDSFTPERERDSTSQSPILSFPVPPSSSSSSPHLRSSRAQESSTALQLKVEQAIKKTDSKCLQNNPKDLLTANVVLRRRPGASFVSKRPTSELLRGLGAEERKELSPGLLYLEQVCQMLEEIAKQQMHSRALQMETDALREHQDLEESQALDACQSDSKPSEEDIISCETLEIQESSEQISSEPQQRRDHPYRLFRQRSASDTNISSESEKQEMPKTNKNWKMKFGSFTRESSLRDSKGQQMQSSERNSARRRLSQLFRRKTTKAVTV
ncbi:Kinesin-like protein KIN-14C [Dissostichus eleginoides]|uniref:Kinesin-like protein KIN-14C n=1 Tax=Dissostichus eleginoides TaxID=100907 RepID=A0AAD9BKE1_DISEL|nr:Kinesin-like protein KIN-14C [Dissostichus eleginoides]